MALLLHFGALACRDTQSPVAPPEAPPTIFAGSAKYEVIILGDLGGDQVEPLAINDNRQIVGYSLTATGELHPFLWENGTMHDLGPVNGSKIAHVINDAGQVAGRGAFPGPYDGWFWAGGLQQFDLQDAIVRPVDIDNAGTVLASVDRFDRSDAVLWAGGVARWLGHLSDVSVTIPAGSNNRGQVVGASLLIQPPFTSYNHPFLWDNGVMRDLGVLGLSTQEGQATDINDRGEVVGWSYDSSYVQRAFIWKDGVMRDLGGFPGEWTHATIINESGQVAGTHSLSRGAFWDGAAALDLGADGVSVVAMNDHAEIVGRFPNAAGVTRAFVWREGQLHDLGSGTADGETTRATGINARGDIIGVVEIAHEPRYAVLWRRVNPAP